MYGSILFFMNSSNLHRYNIIQLTELKKVVSPAGKDITVSTKKNPVKTLVKAVNKSFFLKKVTKPERNACEDEI